MLEEEKEIAFDKFFKKFEILKYQFFKKRPILEKNPQRKMEITPGFNHEEVYEEDLKEMPEKNGNKFIICYLSLFLVKLENFVFFGLFCSFVPIVPFF